MGLGAGSLTPNRIGDYAGRALTAEKSEVKAVLMATFQGGICQWVAFLLLAWPGLVWVGGDALPQSWEAWRWWLVPVGPALAVFVFLIALPQVEKIPRIWGRFTGANYSSDEVSLRRNDSADEDPTRFRSGGTTWLTTNSSLCLTSAGHEKKQQPRKGPYLRKSTSPKHAHYLTPVFYSVLRLLVYCTQIYLLMRLGGLELPYVYAMAGIAGVYLLQAGLPLPPGVHLLVRAELAATLFGGEAVVLTAGLTAFSLLYLINVLLPTLLSPYFLLQNKMSHVAKSI